MAHKRAILDGNNTVVNIVLCDNNFPGIGPVGATVPDIGWTWDGVDYVAPPAPPPPPPTADDVRAEAQRRIIALTGATTLIETILKQSNANMRANELNDKRLNGEELTAQEQAEAKALRNLADAIKAIRAASNVMEPSPPANYADDENWLA